MSRLKSLLYAYIYNPSIDNRLNLAEEYFTIQQYAAALSFFLKTAESTEDKNLQYYCLLRCAKCFEIPGNRKHSVITLYKHAINLLPDRPEAYYYLSQTYEWYKDWFDCYTFAVLGLEKTEINDIYTKKLGYQGKYVLLFEKAMSAWWIGRGQEARKIFQVLIHEYNDKLDYSHRQSISSNAISLGCGPLEVCHVPYNSNAHRLRYEFNNYSKIEYNHSQVCQDLFVLSITNGKENGTYLEIGSGDPFHLNNTILLESKFNWKGKGIEWNSDLANRHAQHRKNIVLCENALTVNYEELLASISEDSNIIDYLQLDCEPSNVTYEIMTMIPFNNYKFRVITYEHDYYVDITLSYREKARKFLNEQGYLLVVNDVSPEGTCTFEDWWVHPELVDKDILAKMLDNNSKIKNIRHYMFR